MNKYPLAEAARRIVPPDSGITRPERWVVTRLLDGRFRGQKIGRQWYMTEADIEAAEQSLYPKPKPKPEVTEAQPMSIADALSPRSRRRLLNPP